jgi:dolichol kinase
VSRRSPDELPEPLKPLATKSWLSEAQRKAIHLGSIILPLGILHEWLPWPRGRTEWSWLLIALTVTAIAIDMVRIHEHRVRRLFRDIFGGMIRERERFTLLGSTYLLIAALLCIEIFPRPIAAAALGFTVVGDSLAALVGKAWGRTRFFNKTLEGSAAGLAGCLAWAAYLAMVAHLPWSMVLAGALAATLIELLPIPLDDNIGMTVGSAYVMRLLATPV